MNLLKSMFISNYMMVIMGIAGYAGWMLYHKSIEINRVRLD